MQTNLLPVRGGMREPHRAIEVVSSALVVVVGVNSGVGVGLAWLYAGGGRAVEEIVLLSIPALIAGNAIVVKPSEVAPPSADLCAALCARPWP